MTAATAGGRFRAGLSGWFRPLVQISMVAAPAYACFIGEAVGRPVSDAKTAIVLVFTLFLFRFRFTDKVFAAMIAMAGATAGGALNDGAGSDDAGASDGQGCDGQGPGEAGR